MPSTESGILMIIFTSALNHLLKLVLSETIAERVNDLPKVTKLVNSRSTGLQSQNATAPYQLTSNLSQLGAP